MNDRVVTEKKSRPEKIEPYTPQWERMANAAARSYCPRIYPCQKCGGPVISGYCCHRCGDYNPSRPD